MKGARGRPTAVEGRCGKDLWEVARGGAAFRRCGKVLRKGFSVGRSERRSRTEPRKALRESAAGRCARKDLQEGNVEDAAETRFRKAQRKDAAGRRSGKTLQLALRRKNAAGRSQEGASGRRSRKALREGATKGAAEGATGRRLRKALWSLSRAPSCSAVLKRLPREFPGEPSRSVFPQAASRRRRLPRLSSAPLPQGLPRAPSRLSRARLGCHPRLPGALSGRRLQEGAP